MRKRLGDTLIAAGVIDADQLTTALADAASSGRRVGEVLIAQGICSEDQILGALCRQLNVDAAPLSTTIAIPERVLALVPPSFARAHLLIPLFDDDEAGVLDVALADPSDQERLDELRFHTGRDIRPLVALPSEIADALARFYPEPSTSAPTVQLEIVVARTPTPAPVSSKSGPDANLAAEVTRLQHDVASLLAAQQVMLKMLEANQMIDPKAFGRMLDMALNGNPAEIQAS